MAGERTTIELAAEIAAAFVSNNSVRPADLPTLIGDIHGALQRFSSGAAVVAEPEKPTPAVSIKKSVSDDYIICLEDGRKFKSLKRHLRTAYSLSAISTKSSMAGNARAETIALRVGGWAETPVRGADGSRHDYQAFLIGSYCSATVARLRRSG